MRRRIIKPEFWIDEKIISLPIPARLLFIGMLNVADDEGILKYSPLELKVSIFPADDVPGVNEIKGYIDAMIKLELLTIGYNADKKQTKLIKFINWHNHQKINRPTPTKYIFNDESMINHTLLTDNSVSSNGKLTDDSLPSKVSKVKEVKLNKDKISKSSKKNLENTEIDDFSFERFYSIYPKKVTKKDTELYFKRIAKKELSNVFNGLNKWVNYWTAEGVDKQFIPAPISWLRQKRWADEDIPVYKPKEKKAVFKDALDEEHSRSQENIMRQSQRTRAYFKEATERSEPIPNLLEEYKKGKENSNAQPIGSVIGQVLSNVRPGPSTDGK